MRQCAEGSGGAGGGNAVGVENIAQGDDAFQLVNVGTIDYGKNIQLVFSHALKGEVQSMVGMDVGEGERIDDPAERLIADVGSLGQLRLERLGGDDAHDAAVVLDKPGGRRCRRARLHGLQGLSYGGVRRQETGGSGGLVGGLVWGLAGSLHDPDYLVLDAALASAGRQVNAVLFGEGLVDRLMLEAGRDEQTDHVGDHEGDDDSVVLCHFKDHENGSHGGADDSREDGAHADQRIRAG